MTSGRGIRGSRAKTPAKTWVERKKLLKDFQPSSKVSFKDKK